MEAPQDYQQDQQQLDQQQDEEEVRMSITCSCDFVNPALPFSYRTVFYEFHLIVMFWRQILHSNWISPTYDT